MTPPICRVLITGAHGFIGQNLVIQLGELADFEVVTFTRGDSPDSLRDLVSRVDAVVHLAGENRVRDESVFLTVNAGLTQTLCDAIQTEIADTGRHVPLLLASSTQAVQNTAYGQSKLAAENAVQTLADVSGNPVVIFRLPGVFGKWCKPNYNSVVATFCHNIARNLPIRIDNPDTKLQLAYIDDVIAAFIDALKAPRPGVVQGRVEPVYEVGLSDIAAQLEAFETGRTALHIGRVGTGFCRALYATYVSYLPTEQFVYSVPLHSDSRGAFVEMLKTPDSGQFSFFTALPGITRGGHYHHSKTEKFLVIKGKAHFRFRHLLTDELVEIYTSGEKPEIVETVPGWSHNVTNIGPDELIAMLWANEIFDHKNPDTIAGEV